MKHLNFGGRVHDRIALTPTRSDGGHETQYQPLEHEPKGRHSAAHDQIWARQIEFHEVQPQPSTVQAQPADNH
jgi:hypothetical protein